MADNRQDMLDLIEKWMPTTLAKPNVPDGEEKDLFGHAGWTEEMGRRFKADKDAGKPVTTSCGDILHTLLKLWGSKFLGAFMIRDCDATGHKQTGAESRGYYVKAEDGGDPQPGDVLVLRSGVGKASAGSVGHVGILVEINTDDPDHEVWRTADGGGGLLPDQSAQVTNRTVRRDENNIPILKSPTDNREKQLDGWVDLDKLEREES
jgi:hypothetical protein